MPGVGMIAYFFFAFASSASSLHAIEAQKVPTFFGSLAGDVQEVAGLNPIPGEHGGYKPSPVLQDAGQDFESDHSDFMNLNKLGGYQGELGGNHGFSFFARVKFNKLNTWSRIFDFGYTDNNWNILAGIIKDTPMIFFEIHPGDADGEISWMSSQDVQVKVGVEQAWLFVVDGRGQMQIWRDGYKLLQQDGQPLPEVLRPNLYIGKPNWQHGHGGVNKYFDGSIHDIRIFNQAVDWSAVTMWVRAPSFPGLHNGDFMLANTPVDFDRHTPPSWESSGSIFTASAAGVKKLGGPLPNDPDLLVTALESHGAILKQTLHDLEKGTKYWVAFEAASSATDGHVDGALLTVEVEGEKYLSDVGFSSDEFSKQYFAFVATKSDGTAVLEFLNSSPQKQYSKPRVFISDVKISDVPHCYTKYKTQAKCVGDVHTMYHYTHKNETYCRAQCQKHRCAFMLYDPESLEGASYCEIYPECGTMAMYYGGSFGTLFKRTPCAAGGVMSPETALEYHMAPEIHTAVHHDGPGSAPDTRPGFTNNTMNGHGGNSTNTSHDLWDAMVDGTHMARDSFAHNGDDSFGGGESAPHSVPH